jgi:CheY-like chemotaxis protein
MSNKAQLEILLVDDESSVRVSNSWILEKAGYKVVKAEHGFDALLALQTMMPDLIISDLNMPQMSGFEFLSVVRRRFPEIPVLAVSGAYDSGDQVPGGVIADDFYSKTRHDPAEFLRRVTDLIQSTREKQISHHRQSAPVWIPRNGKDSNGVPFIVVTCTQCLRSFPVSVLKEGVQEIQETPCLFCASPVRYIIDFSLAVYSPRTHGPRHVPAKRHKV